MPRCRGRSARTREYSPAELAEFSESRAPGPSPPPRRRSKRAAAARAGINWLIAGGIFSIAVARWAGTGSFTCSASAALHSACSSSPLRWRQSSGRHGGSALRHPERPLSNAARDAPARGRAVPLLVWTVRDVDLHDLCGDEPPLRQRRIPLPRHSTRARTGSACCSPPTTASRRSPRCSFRSIAARHRAEAGAPGQPGAWRGSASSRSSSSTTRAGCSSRWSASVSPGPRSFRFPMPCSRTAVPPEKMGMYMGIFNFFIVIPQIMAASLLGVLVRAVFDGESIYALATGGVLMILAGLATLRVDDREGWPAVKRAALATMIASALVGASRGRARRRRKRTSTARRAVRSGGRLLRPHRPLRRRRSRQQPAGAGRREPHLRPAAVAPTASRQYRLPRRRLQRNPRQR